MPSRSSRTSARLGVAAVAGALTLGALALPASAAPLTTHGGLAATDVALVSQSNGAPASFNADGTDSAIRLEALAGSSVSQVRFSYTIESPVGGAPIPGSGGTIATVSRNDDGAFGFDWTPPSTLTSGSKIDVTVSGLNATGTVITNQAPYTGITVNSTGTTFNIAAEARKGYFKQPYASPRDGTQIGVPITTSTQAASAQSKVTLGWLSARGWVSQRTDSVDSGSSFGAQVDIRDYPFSTDVDQIAVYGQSTTATGTAPQSDEVEAYQLYAQKITKVTATPDRTNVGVGESASVTVTVTDQNGNPIAGAEVRRSSKPTATAVGNDLGYTDGNGQVVLQQFAGTDSYYANATGTGTYSATDGDVKSADVAITQYTAVPTTLTGASADGPAFDLDEADNAPSAGTGGDGDATDVTVQVTDQKGAKVAPSGQQTLSYYWSVTPFTGGTPTRFPATGTTTATSEGNGLYDVTVPAGGNGVYDLYAQLSADPVSTTGGIASTKVLSVRAGQAAVTWSRTSPEKLSAGAVSPVVGQLALPDGTGLPGRSLALTFKRDSTTTNEDPTPDAGFDTGSATTTGTSTTVTTGSGGSFTAVVRDPADSPQQDELGDTIDAASAANGYGDAGASTTGHGVDFVYDPVVAGVQLTESREGATTRAGEYTLYTVRTVNAGGGGVPGQTVTLTTDHGYFSKDDGNASTTAPTAPAGAGVGVYQNDGTSLTLTTGSDGSATVFLAMGRDAGFDDDGAVSSTVRAASGSFSATDAHAWTSANPLAAGSLSIVPSRHAQDSAILPKAQTVDAIYLDVVAKDSFGNVVGGAPVSLSDDTASGQISESDGTANDGTVSSDFLLDGDAVLTDPTAETQKVTGSWTAGSSTVTGTYAATWYAIDYAASSASLTHDAGRRRVGEVVTETYTALDQLGQPIPNLYVAFTRTGPGASSDASGASDGVTGQDGVLTYAFQGATAGTATVRATVRQGSASGTAVPAASASDTVAFATKARIVVRKVVDGAKVVLRVQVADQNYDPATGRVALREGSTGLGRHGLRGGATSFVLRGVKPGVHRYTVTFLGNATLRKTSRTVEVTVTR